MLRRQAVLEGVAVAVLAVGLLSSPGCTQWQAARLYQSGSQALQAGDVDRAIDELSAAARLVPQASEIRTIWASRGSRLARTSARSGSSNAPSSSTATTRPRVMAWRV